MTYAFNVPDGRWGTPYDVCPDRAIIEMVDEGLSSEDIEQIILNESEEYLMKKYNLRKLSSALDIEGVNFAKEEIIQYRVRIGKPPIDEYDDLDHDFHFKVLRNGVWLEKLGGYQIRKCKPWIDEDDHEENYYTSRTLTFAHSIIHQSKFDILRKLSYNIIMERLIAGKFLIRRYLVREC